MLSDLQTLGFKTHTDVNESYELFQSTLISHFNDHYPLQTENIYNKADRKPWITREY